MQSNADVGAAAENLKDAAMTTFDYSTQAELFPTRARKSKPRSFGYKRFEKAADAIRFAIEELPPDLLIGAYLEVEEARFNYQGIRQLYESADYPLTRRSVGTTQ
jgi:hypothetical protein